MDAIHPIEQYSPDGNKIVHETSVDFEARATVSHPVHIVQYDDSMPIIEISLYRKGKAYTLPEGACGNIRVTKKDGNFVYNPVLGCNEARNKVYVEVTKQMTALYGPLNPIIELTNGNTVAGSAAFALAIEKNPLQDHTIRSTNEFQTLVDYVNDAQNSAKAAKDSENAAKASEDAAKDSENKAKASEEAALASQNAAKDSEDAAAQSAAEAAESASEALASQNAAKESENAAAQSAAEALVSQEAAKESQDAAKESQDAAKDSEDKAKEYAEQALASQNAAKDSEEKALASQEAAAESETNAEDSAQRALASQEAAAKSEGNAEDWSKLSESYAHGQTDVRPGEETDNSMYYYEQAKRISQGLNGVLLPMGSVAFEDLENQTKEPGYTYNITTEFVTTEDFEEGPGHYYAPGANVYWTAEGKWDVLAPVLNGADKLPAKDNEHILSVDVRESATTQELIDELARRFQIMSKEGSIYNAVQDWVEDYVLSSESEEIDGTSKFAEFGVVAALKTRIDYLERTVEKLVNQRDHFMYSMIDEGILPTQMRRNVLRYNCLGTAVSDAQWSEMSRGNFQDMFLGDYWLIDGFHYRIADVDYMFNTGNTQIMTKHHLVIVPDENMGSAAMNATAVTTTGYKGAAIRTGALATARTKVETDFTAAHVLPYSDILTTASANGIASAHAWTENLKVELMNEAMVYGSRQLGSGNPGSTAAALYTICRSQLALFQLDPTRITTRYTYWLRDIVSATIFAGVIGDGESGSSSASASGGLRPFFLIG